MRFAGTYVQCKTSQTFYPKFKVNVVNLSQGRYLKLDIQVLCSDHLWTLASCSKSYFNTCTFENKLNFINFLKFNSWVTLHCEISSWNKLYKHSFQLNLLARNPRTWPFFQRYLNFTAHFCWKKKQYNININRRKQKKKEAEIFSLFKK